MAYIKWVHLLLAFSHVFSTFSADISRKELRSEQVNQKAFIQLNQAAVQYHGLDPSRVTQLSWRPRVFLYKRFLSDAECDHLISLVRDKKEKIDMSKAFESSETPLSVEDKIGGSIEERTSAWTFLPKENSKILQVMYYGPEEAKQDYNFFGNRSMIRSSEPLMATIVLYLSNVTRGGDINFPQSEIRSDCSKPDNALRPIKGNAILFFSVHPNASPDKSSSHVRCPVLEGEMWCARKTFHVRKINNEINLSESDGDDCVDEDENCSRWAAAGECQRNHVYMLGSPDYYGKCRKSCNACYEVVRIRLYM